MDGYADFLLPEALLVDFPLIDAQHDEIFREIELLKEACVENGYAPSKEFDALVALFATHFATEEQLATDLGVDFAEHARTHEQTLLLLRKASSEVVEMGRDPHSLLRYCAYWFERHINEKDRRFASWLAA